MHTVAFVGLGNMGLPMATRLVGAGHVVRGVDPSPDARAAAGAAGIETGSALADAVPGADVVVTMLPSGAEVLDVLDVVIDAAAPGTRVLDCSTIDIADARRAHARATDAGLAFVDAPVSGGIGGAAAGTLTIMAGGERAALDALAPLLDAVSARVVHCGGAGAGQAAKVCNNMLLATSMIGTAEAFSLGEKLGLDPGTLFDVVSTSSGACWSVTTYCPLPGVGPRSPADDGYRPGFPARLMTKDLSLMERAADSVEQATPLGSHALALYRAFVAAGGRRPGLLRDHRIARGVGARRDENDGSGGRAGTGRVGHGGRR